MTSSRGIIVAAAVSALAAGAMIGPPSDGHTALNAPGDVKYRAPRPRDQCDKKRRKPLKRPKRVTLGIGREKAHREHVARVRAEQSSDNRHDKYLHSHARSMRRFVWVNAHPGKPIPQEWGHRA